MLLTQDQKNVLGFVVADPQAWADNAESKMGLEKATIAMLAKVTKYWVAYDVAILAGNYKDRLTQDLAEEKAKLDKWAADLPTAKAKRKKEIDERVASLFSEHVDKHYLKKTRHADRGRSPIAIPASVENYSHALTDNQDVAGAEINILTTVKDVRDYKFAEPDVP